jgi:hypothetical protein
VRLGALLAVHQYLIGPVETGDHALVLAVQFGNCDLERCVVDLAGRPPCTASWSS